LSAIGDSDAIGVSALDAEVEGEVADPASVALLPHAEAVSATAAMATVSARRGFIFSDLLVVSSNLRARSP